MPANLVRTHPGHYKTEDGSVRVMRHTGRTWNPSRGSYGYTTWVAILSDANAAELAAAREEGRPVRDETYEVAKADTLAKLRERLGKYLDDRAAGALGPRSKYGWPGDARPAAAS